MFFIPEPMQDASTVPELTSGFKLKVTPKKSRTNRKVSMPASVKGPILTLQDSSGPKAVSNNAKL